jgi:hypothetical protein
MPIFKVEAQGDTIYIEADTKLEAENDLVDFAGDIPPELLTWTENVELPEGEEVIAKRKLV